MSGKAGLSDSTNCSLKLTGSLLVAVNAELVLNEKSNDMQISMEKWSFVNELQLLDICPHWWLTTRSGPMTSDPPR